MKLSILLQTHMQSEIPCPGICHKALQTGVCLRCCCGIRIQMLMFQAECFASGENIPQTEFPTKLALVRVSAAIQVQTFLLFWHQTSSFDVMFQGEILNRRKHTSNLSCCRLRYLSTFGCNSSFSLHLQARNQAFSYTDQQSRAISHYTEHSDKSQTFYEKQRTCCNQ